MSTGAKAFGNEDTVTAKNTTGEDVEPTDTELKLQQVREEANRINDKMKLNVSVDDINFELAGKRALKGNYGALGVESGTVYLSDRLTIGSTRFTQTLAEELVHYKQWSRGLIYKGMSNSIRAQAEFGAATRVMLHFKTTRDYRQSRTCWGYEAAGKSRLSC